MAEAVTVLLIEADHTDAFAIREVLEAQGGGAFRVVHFEDIDSALAGFTDADPDVILLDLDNPDAQGIEAVPRVCSAALGKPVMVLTGVDDEEAGMNALHSGAQDYIVKGKTDPIPLPRAVRFAMGRHQLLVEARQESLQDDLSGLSNRRGFVVLSEQQLKLANRHGKALMLLYADMDGLKDINDTHGHAHGDQAINDVANIFRTTFRDSDIIARLGGDEFAVLMVDFPPDETDRLPGRLLRTMAEHNTSKARPYTLSVSLGTAFYDPKDPCSIFELLHRADQQMYSDKRQRGKGRQ
ncbi:MAG TPA: GGDEF domain-containing response regulator [Armatimonadota bacterium]|nr:GGDEF domain-containing response regulator [Armatimonadota bacterium]